MDGVKGLVDIFSTTQLPFLQFYDFALNHVLQFYVIPYNMISVILYHTNHCMSCHATSYHIVSYDMISYQFISDPDYARLNVIKYHT